MNLIKKPKYGKKVNLIIIGAGEAGRLITDQILENTDLNYNVLALIDDDLNKIGKEYKGLQILGPISTIQNILNQYNADELLIAMPSVTGELIKKITRECRKTKLDIKILPTSFESLVVLEKGIAGFENIRSLKIEDLFIRKPVIVDLEEIKNKFNGKTILVSGGAGSIGSELCKQLLEFNISRLIALDQSEGSIHKLILDLKKYSDKLIPIIGSIRDRPKLKNILNEYKPEIVFHAAAYKHVPLMEENVDEAVTNNIFGTKNMIDLAEENNVSEFILISSDKAVNPTSVMGASKRLTEMMIQSKLDSNTKFIAVRFGNVINSIGSVIPIFQEQIEKGGPLTVTHPEMKRFFMTIPEAVHLIIQAPLLGKNKNIFVLDMGEQVFIKNLAEELIRLNGFEPYEDIKIKFTGLRPGEKLYEELTTNKEDLNKTENQRIFLINPEDVNPIELDSCLNNLKIHLETRDIQSIVNELKKIIPNSNIKNGQTGLSSV